MKQENSTYTFSAICPAGIENLVYDEVRESGGHVVGKVLRGLVRFSGSLETAYRFCLWSRFASRLLLLLDSFSAENEEQLYQKAYEYNWQEHMDASNSFAIQCNLAAGSTIHHSKYAALKLKDGLVDFFREKVGVRPSVQVKKPDLSFNLHIDAHDQATLSLDLSGESLHLRGYRERGVAAPLKENLAAAIVALSGWNKKESFPLLDPMCGSGTLLIEAALMFGDSAPGLSRSHFGFLGWKNHESSLWNSLIEEAIEREEKGLDRTWPKFLGYDAEPQAVIAARKNIENAGLSDHIHVNVSHFSKIQKPAKEGYILTNPPYGERLSEKQQVAFLYKGMGRHFADFFPGWMVGMFVAGPDLADNIGVKWEKRHKLFNGSIACCLLTGKTEENAAAVYEKHVWKMNDFTLEEGEGGDFCNRLKKNGKKILKWAERENITCFRLYDRDLPNFNLSVDVYEKWMHVQEYAPPKDINEERAKKRFDTALFVLRKLFGISRERIFIKTRRRQRGKKQYQKGGSHKKMFTVKENGCFLLVNFTDYLDTGLFLDHRPVRKEIQQTARGKRFLNLFGYTGSASVHAAVGGAVSTTTVDLSNTYIDWAKSNFSLNGIGGQEHLFAVADCMQWVEEQKKEYDVIFVDPPTFSNTKKKKRVFDIQRDHLQLITRCMQLLSQGGVLYFSTNFTRFSLNASLEKKFNVKDITKWSIPADFSKNKTIHKCWRIQHV